MLLGNSIYKLALYVFFSIESAKHQMWQGLPVETWNKTPSI